MILGVGQDVTDIRRIAATLLRFGDRFSQRVFTEVERRRATRGTDPAPSFAKRFAAKEACAKALGTGLRHGVFWRDMGVVNAPSGQPTLALTGGAAARLKDMTPDGWEARIHLSLTDEPPYAVALVIIEALPFSVGRSLAPGPAGG